MATHSNKHDRLVNICTRTDTMQVCSWELSIPQTQRITSLLRYPKLPPVTSKRPGDVIRAQLHHYASNNGIKHWLETVAFLLNLGFFGSWDVLFTLFPLFINNWSLLIETGVLVSCPGIMAVLIAVIRSTNPRICSCHLTFDMIVDVRVCSITLTLSIFLKNLNKSVWVANQG